jgi:outer membrane receptor protein involved in Fe transport
MDLAWMTARRAAAAAMLSAILTTAPTGARAAEEVAAAPSVIAYPAAFFAAMNAPTAYEMVLRVPGFTIDDGSAVRGFAGAAGNVLIDGQRPASKTDDLISILRRIPAGRVERIDLIRGGQTGIDMQGKTVVVNVVRRGGGGFSGAVTFAGSKPEAMPFDPQLKLEGAWRGGGRSAEASLLINRFHDFGSTDGPHDLIAPDGRLTDVSPMHNEALAWQNILTAGFETPAWGGRLRLNLTLEDQPYDNLSVDHFQVAGTKVERDRQDATDAELGARYSRGLAKGLSLELFGLQHLNKSGSNSTFDQASGRQAFRLSHLGGETIGRLVMHWRPSPTLTVDGGGEYAYNWVQTRTSLSQNGAAISVPAADVTVHEDRAEVFTTATWRPRGDLTLETGARVERSTIASRGDVILSKTLTFPKPRLVATWTPDSADQVRLRVEREVGQLDFNQFVANAALNGVGVTAGNPDLTPQQDWTVEATYERHFWKDGVASLGVQRLWLTDVIDRAPVFGPSGVFDEPANIGSGEETAVTASWTLPLERLGAKGATGAVHGDLAHQPGDRSDHAPAAVDLGAARLRRRPAPRPGPAAVEDELGDRQLAGDDRAGVPLQRDRHAPARLVRPDLRHLQPAAGSQHPRRHRQLRPPAAKADPRRLRRAARPRGAQPGGLPGPPLRHGVLLPCTEDVRLKSTSRRR